MFAVIETGGKQYRVAPGDRIQVEKLPGEPGSQVEFRVLAVQKDEDPALIAGSALEGAKVTATIVRGLRGKKVIVYKFKRKKQYQRKNGHRQNLVEVEVNQILTGAQLAPETGQSVPPSPDAGESTQPAETEE